MLGILNNFSVTNKIRTYVCLVFVYPQQNFAHLIFYATILISLKFKQIII